MIPGYNEGANITLLDTFYHKARKDPETGKYIDDVLSIIYEDMDTGKKGFVDIKNPEYTFYKINDSEYLDYNRIFIEKELCEPITVPYRDVLKTIAKLTDNMDYFYNNKNSGNYAENNRLHTMMNIMNSDMDIEDHYRIKFSRMYQNVPKLKPSKGYFDIEADTILDAKDFPELGEFPINAISFVDELHKTIKVLLLRTSEKPNHLIKEFEDRIKHDPKGMTDKLKNFVINHVGGEKKYHRRYKMTDFTYEYIFFDEEIVLIQTLFDLINSAGLDFILAWNMGFDIPYIYARLSKLGYDPIKIMCHPDYYPDISIHVDNFHTEFKEKTSYFKISSPTVYIDQLINFASRRSGTKYPNYRLDTISKMISSIGKLSYSHLTQHLPSLPYIDYETFVFYNVCDTIAQYCIEYDTQDIEYIYTKCNMNFSRYDICHRQSMYLTNRATMEYYNDGFIIGNNCRKFKPKEGSYPGAMVHDPLLTDDTYRIKIKNFVLNMIRNGDDFDFKSLYPSTALQNNIGHNTQIGRIIIDEKPFYNEDPFKIKDYNRGGQFIEDFTSQNIIEFCKRWLGFGGYTDVMNDLEEYINLIRGNSYRIGFFDDGQTPIAVPIMGDKCKDMIVRLNAPIEMVYKIHRTLIDKEYYNELFPAHRRRYMV